MMKRLSYKMFLGGLVLLLASGVAQAAIKDKWPNLKKSFFSGKTIVENVDFIKLKSPVRSDNGAQVPFHFSIDRPMEAGNYIKSVQILVGVNPSPLVGIFHFNPRSGKAAIDTRIRIEEDTMVHVVAEDNKGKLYMAATPIKASGGCGGAADSDVSALLVGAGKIKVKVGSSADSEGLIKARLMVKHPMFSGFQRVSTSQAYIPAFFISRASVSHNGYKVLDVDIGIGMSENPNILFNFVSEGKGVLEVKLEDTEGTLFSKKTDI